MPLGDEINTDIRTLTVRPFIPEPDVPELLSEEGVLSEKPLAYPLERFTPGLLIGVLAIQLCYEFVEVGHGPTTRPL